MISDYENLKKKILHRSKYRGVKELDILFEKFINKYSDILENEDFHELNQLLDVPDSDLLYFVLNPKKVPGNLKNKTFYRLLNL